MVAKDIKILERTVLNKGVQVGFFGLKELASCTSIQELRVLISQCAEVTA